MLKVQVREDKSAHRLVLSHLGQPEVCGDWVTDLRQPCFLEFAGRLLCGQLEIKALDAAGRPVIVVPKVYELRELKPTPAGTYTPTGEDIERVHVLIPRDERKFGRDPEANVPWYLCDDWGNALRKLDGMSASRAEEQVLRLRGSSQPKRKNGNGTRGSGQPHSAATSARRASRQV